MRSSLPFRLLIVLLIVVALLPVACSGQESTWDLIRRRGVLRVGLDPTYPPFEFYDGASLHGIDVDLAKAIAAELGLEVEFSHFGFDGLYDALATEQVDVLISALVQDITRTQDFAYSDGYIDGGLVLVSPAEQPIHAMPELAGQAIAVELGAAGHVEATIWQRQVRDLSVATFNSADEALLALSGGQAEAAITDNITYRLFDQPAAGVEFVVAPLTSEPYAFVVRQGDDELLSALDASLGALRADGRLQAILNGWFPG
jgi:polar amino acid transport system substrate-binding protein